MAEEGGGMRKFTGLDKGKTLENTKEPTSSV